MIGRVAEILKTREREDWLRALSARSIPCSPVHTLGELSNHPHTEQSGMILHDGDFKTVASPLRAGGERPALRTRPPLLGEHTEQILSETGFDKHDIEHLASTGALGERHAR